MRIDLNCDMGESFGRYTLGQDQQVIAHITSANVACGFHASDPQVMDRTMALAKEHGVAVGAHPGYLDLRGFGRRNLDCDPEEVRTDLIYQTGALAAMAQSQGLKLQHVKPHGALYNTAAGNKEVAKAICSGLASYDSSLALVALAGPGGEVIRGVAQEHGLKVAAEAFADRAYTPAGRLVPRNQPGAVIHDPDLVAARCLRMAQEGVVEAADGSLVPLKPHTICVHGDTPTAVELVERITTTLKDAGVELTPLGQLV
jgi:UPF0271 protein